MSKEKITRDLTRRTFLKSAAAGVGVAALSTIGLSGARAAITPGEVPKWDDETDILVLGYGGAGASAAIAAHDAGAKVLIVEKAPFGGGNTGCCLGAMLLPNNVPDAINYYRALSFGTVQDEKLIRAFAEALVGLPGKLKEWGIEVTYRMKNLVKTLPRTVFPTLPGVGCIDYLTAGSGKKVFAILADNVQKRGIKILYESPAKKLIQDPSSKEVKGVVVEHKGQQKYIKAGKAVILATGGFENNTEMQNYYYFPGLRLYPFGSPYNTGDGVKMAFGVGADQWHFSCVEWLGLCMKAPTEAKGMAVTFGFSPGGCIIVNKKGKRFINEAKRLSHRKDPMEFTFFNHEQAEYANMPAFAIFDENYRIKNPLYPSSYKKAEVGYAAAHDLDKWSNDNSEEIEKGWILKGGSIEELATKIGVDPIGLKKSIDIHNQNCQEGKNSEFGRPAKTCAPLELPPFYAVELAPVIINTQGGPKHNFQAQALDIEGNPIPRLYTPGELGSFFGHLYQGGNNFPEALAFGRIAGEAGAKEKAWEKA